jgi:hypothetical protein
MNDWRTILAGLFLIFLGILAITKSNKWIMLIVDTWFFREPTKSEIDLMRIGLKIIAIIQIAIGASILISLWF